jgi:hypothetical protein
MQLMAKRQNHDLRRWAVIGAEHRLLQIAEEAATIFQVFPELRDRGFMAQDAASVKIGKRGRASAVAVPAPRKRRKLSAAARKRIGDAQRKRWAKQKAMSGK